MTPQEVKALSDKLQAMYGFVTAKYYEVEDFAQCILLSMLSRTNMIALGQPGIAKSAVLREFVNMIDFTGAEGTPYFHVQMGADVSPNNVLGAPDIEYYKNHGIIRRATQGFLPDAIIAFCSEFYRVNDQVANSGLLTILNEGEFKNGTDILKTRLRFFMADTNFFPKQPDDLDAEESDLRLQALHDRFLARVLVKPLSEDENKVRMILMDDDRAPEVSLGLHELIALQELAQTVEIPRQIALYMVLIANDLQSRHRIFISPRRLKLSRNLVRAHALLQGRLKCTVEDLSALQFAFWQKEEDIRITRDLIFDTIGLPQADARRYEAIQQSILDELHRNIENHQLLPGYDPDSYYSQALKDLTALGEEILTKYHPISDYTALQGVHHAVIDTIRRLTVDRFIGEEE